VKLRITLNRLTGLLIAIVSSVTLGIAFAESTRAAVIPHGLGLPAAHKSLTTVRKAPRATRSSAGLPDNVNLTQYAPPVGDQGEVNSCAAWSTAYTALGYWTRRDNIFTLGFGAPMYAFSQTVIGNDQANGSYIDANLDIAAQQGIDDQGDYWQGNDDWWDLPTASETANAGHWQLTQYAEIPADQADIEATRANGDPVTIAMPVTMSFEENTSGVYPDGNGYDDYAVLGNHAVTALGYNSSGLLIENQWGPFWGASGYVTISWDWVNTYVLQAFDVADMVHPAPSPPVPPTPPKPPTPPTPTPTPPPPTHYTAPPAPKLTAHPAKSTRSTTATFRFTDSGKGVRFSCSSRRNGAFGSCKSPEQYTKLPYGTRTFRVRATDSHGTSKTTTYTWKIHR
jgi:Papain family cysteine protease